MTDLAAEMREYHLASLVTAAAGIELCERLGIAAATHTGWWVGRARVQSAGGVPSAGLPSAGSAAGLWEPAGDDGDLMFSLPVCVGEPLDGGIIDLIAFNVGRPQVFRRMGSARLLGTLDPEDDGGAVRLVSGPQAWLREGERRAAARERRGAEILPPKSRPDDCLGRTIWFASFYEAACILDWREMQPRDFDGIGRLVCDDEAHAALVHAELEKCWRRGRLAPRPKVWIQRPEARDQEQTAGLPAAVAPQVGVG